MAIETEDHGQSTAALARGADGKPAARIASINPATGEVLKTFEPLSDVEIDARIARAADAFRTYRRTGSAERAGWMRRAAELLEAEKDSLSRLMTLEMGKPVRGAVDEVLKCARGARYNADHAERLLADELVATEAACSYVRYQPLGPILAVMPWNFPLWQVFRFATPALMAGNVILLKHASNVPQSALAIEDLMRRAGFPEGVLQTLLIGSDKVERLLADRRVRAATLTGSVAAGRQVAGMAGRQIKKTVLELGGSDPFVVTPHANLDEAVTAAVKARIINNGQSCIAAKRFILVGGVADAFEPQFVVAMQALRVGDPLDPATDVGPLATADGKATLEEQVRQTVAAGARVLTGGYGLERHGFFYAPTVLADIPRHSPVYRDEMFGPVASLFRVRDLDEAIELANDSDFGLGASLWSDDEAERAQFIEIEAGVVFVNGIVTSDPRLPFGGVKDSGYGRELGIARHP